MTLSKWFGLLTACGLLAALGAPAPSFASTRGPSVASRTRLIHVHGRVYHCPTDRIRRQGRDKPDGGRKCF